MDILGILSAIILGIIGVIVSLAMQNEQKQKVADKLKSINHGLVDDMPVKVGIFAGIVIGSGIGFFIGGMV